MSVGNHVVQARLLENKVRGYWTLVDSPLFVIGGIMGQAMSAADVVNSVARMFRATDANIYVNGDQSQQTDSPLELHVWLSPVDGEL
jgi:hypothetical protein